MKRKAPSSLLAKTLAKEENSDDILAIKQRNEELERRISQLERVVRISQILNSTLSLEPLLQIIIQSVTELTGAEVCSILLIDENTEDLRFVEATGGIHKLKKVVVPMENSIAGWVVRENQPILIRDPKEDKRWHKDVDEYVDFETRSILAVPLNVRNTVIGVLEVLNKEGDEDFSQEDLQIATILSTHASIAIENARLLDRLQQAYRELSELDQIKEDFVSIAAHELRTPLTVILGYASFIRRDATGKLGEKLDIVLSSATQLRSIIDEMVNLRYINNNDVQLEWITFSLKQLVAEVIEEFAGLGAGKQQIMTTRFVPDTDHFNIYADMQKVYLVLANLVSNAIKFTPQKGRIHINVSKKGQKYQINVIDTGIGIPKDQFTRIFDQFYQVEPSSSRRYQGMGLGLSIVKGLVEVHEGKVWVESIEGKGSNFFILLPINVEGEINN